MKTLKLTEYLNEKRLGEVLKFVFEGCEIVSQYRIKTPDKIMIVDYAIQTKFGMMFVEFNGNFHFQKALTQHRDILLDLYCIENNIELITIPYFIQLDSYSAKLFFSSAINAEYFSEIEIQTSFPHGFISEKIVMPCDFNTIGWNVFSDFMSKCFQERKLIANAINDSLFDKFSILKFKQPMLIFGASMATDRMTPDDFAKDLIVALTE